MKKLLAMLLIMAALLPAFDGLKVNAAAATDITPFTMVNWDPLDKEYTNVFSMPKFLVDRTTLVDTGVWEMRWSGTSNLKTMATYLKAYMSKIPKGSRFIQVATYTTFLVKSQHVIYMDEGTALLRNWLDSFLKEYKAMGGELDGIALDTEYNLPAAHYLYTEQYQKGNTQIYQQIQDHPLYATEVRPMLEERGFKFYTGAGKSELYYLHNDYADSHADSQLIWNKVMNIRKAQYQNKAICEPLLKYYPDALVSDYNVTNTYAWLKTPGDNGYTGNAGGNLIEVGNTSNIYTYAHRPSLTFIKYDGTYPPGYNKAVIEDNAFDAFLWDMRVFKDAQAAADDGDGGFNAWVTYYDYRIGKPTRNANTVSGTPYHTETLYHIGLLNPQPFLGYVIPSEIATDTGTSGSAATAEYNKRIQNISDILSELTRVVGASDRKPIEYAGSWNSDFVISGMYAGGRNVWRISPDTTKGVSLAEFKLKDKAPTFRINGQTVIFPQGRIIQESKIEPYGSCGYWVETPKGVEPVVINDVDRHSKYPAYGEAFSAALNTKFWKTTGTATVKNGALTLSNGATVKNVTIPKQITAGDNYAKQQAWEITVTLPSSLSSTEVMLLSCGTNDGFRVKSGKLQYSQAGTYKDLASLSAGGKYTVKREVDFTAAGAYKSSFYVYNASGNLIAQQTNVPMTNLTLPVTTISFSAKTASGQTVQLDDYKLYPMGVTTDFELYDAKTGYKVTGTTNAGATAYRLSWMNASDTTKKATIVAEFYNGGTRVSTKTIREITMSPGADGVETEIVPLSAGTSVKLTLQTAGSADVVWPNYDNGDFNWTATGTNQGGTNTGTNQGGTNTGTNQGGTNTGTNQGGTNTGTNQGGTNTGTNQGGANTGSNQGGQTDNTEETTLPDNTTGETTLPDNTTGETSLPDNTTGETTLPDNTTGGTNLPGNTEQTTPADPSKPGNKKGLSGSMIALIAVLSVIVAVAVAFGILFLIKKESAIPWLIEITKRIFKKK